MSAIWLRAAAILAAARLLLPACRKSRVNAKWMLVASSYMVKPACDCHWLSLGSLAMAR